MHSLGKDLALRRKELKLSIEDVHQSTKIPVAILESIEDNSIFTTLDENTTYIRSYIRSYARALKIDDIKIIRALDQNEKGNYTGFTGFQQETVAGLNTEEQDESPDPAESTGPDPNEEVVHDHESEPTPPGRIQQSPDRRALAPPTVNSVDWVDLGKRFTPLQSKSRMWIGLLLLMLAIIATAFYVIYQNYYLDSNSDTEPVQSSSATEPVTPDADSLQLNFVAPSEDQERRSGVSETALEALPDTLSLVIFAAHGILEPVRVFTDVMDSLNPYWIEQGEAYRFDFVNTLRIRGQYSRMALLFNGHLIPNFRQQFYNPETGMLEIDRNFFENDTTWLQPPPDSLDIDAPYPAMVRERPIFN